MWTLHRRKPVVTETSMPFSSAGKNLMLNAFKGTNPAVSATYASLHTDLPNDSGSNEATGGSPAYARKAIAWNAASSGSMDKDATDPVFDVPASTTIMFVGFWSAITSGTFLGYAPINGGAVKGAGTADATTNAITAIAHGLTNNLRVTVSTVAGASIPTGLSVSTVYYVVGATTDTFQVSLTLGGSAVDITASNDVGFQNVVPETYASQGTLTIDTATLDLNG